MRLVRTRVCQLICDRWTDIGDAFFNPENISYVEVISQEHLRLNFVQGDCMIIKEDIPNFFYKIERDENNESNNRT